MGVRRNPAADVVAFFETAQIDAALTVLAICKGVVARRTPKPTKKPRAGKRAAAADRGPETSAPLLGGEHG